MDFFQVKKLIFGHKIAQNRFNFVKERAQNCLPAVVWGEGGGGAKDIMPPPFKAFGEGHGHIGPPWIRQWP